MYISNVYSRGWSLRDLLTGCFRLAAALQRFSVVVLFGTVLGMWEAVITFHCVPKDQPFNVSLCSVQGAQ